jgi:hypothetical protein
VAPEGATNSLINYATSAPVDASIKVVPLLTAIEPVPPPPLVASETKIINPVVVFELNASASVTVYVGTTKPLSEMTGPENVVFAIVIFS